MKKMIYLLLFVMICSFAYSLDGYVDVEQVALKEKAEVQVDFAGQKIIVEKDDNRFIFLIGERNFFANNEIYHLEKPPLLKDFRFYLPEEFISNYLTPKKVVHKVRRVTELMCSTYSSYTRIVLNLTDNVKYEDSIKKEKLIVKLPGMSIEKEIDKNQRDGSMEGYKLYTKEDAAILEISLGNKFKNYNISLLNKPYKLIIDLNRKKEQSEKINKKNLLKIIVLDPGHGGKDPGAVGIDGVFEKDIVLDIAKRLKKKIESRMKGVKVYLTRDRDEFIPLAKRSQIANRLKADLFISIHCNYSYSKKASGFEVYYLSRYASDEEARGVAAFENGVIELEDKSADNMVMQILSDIMLNEFENDSIEVCGLFNLNWRRKMDIPSRGVKHAKFYVLYNTTMPACLLELGFLTNKSDKRKLMDKKYRDKICDILVESINEFREKYNNK